MRIPRRRRWWIAIPGLGVRTARQIEVFFASHPELTERARALVAVVSPEPVVPWERIHLPHEVDGSHGTFRAPQKMCALKASNDYEAIGAWLGLHEAAPTQRAYRREAERLLLWAILERGKALSSLTTEDATAYRAFLRHPAPRGRWVAPARPRSSPEWRPFTGRLSPRSIAYAISVLGAMFRWLIEQRYVLANPFAGLKVRGAQRSAGLDASRAFTPGERELVRTLADGLEWSHGWTAPAAQRLRFLLDFGYATGLRAGELVGVTLGGIETGSRGERWLHLVGKGAKPGKVALPSMARHALDQYLMQRGLPVTPARWKPDTPLVGNLGEPRGITTPRMRDVVGSYVAAGAELVEVAHLSSMKARIYVSEVDLRKVREAADARVYVDALLRSVLGRVSTVGPASSDVEEGVIPKQEYKGISPPHYYVATLLLSNADGALKVGMSGTARIYIDRTWSERRSLAGFAWQRARELTERKLW
jgi:site-specific recombinase XerD